ncbi:uncharacterized protein LOC122052750 isoform X1 [Zingiber officinale]|uniref:uncharacterized protein LOC122052750 isoform X1 n=2 Tax=Zingiber officinale TaxID=94328 RepID=UPI001C4ABF2E|nr:uncharacterized protein LOC122052750 isoform X1 [Zingiber officinale]XP_042470369.1 uncharacterized protein LOC122052750 isoform X1 [Zingiber officinale]XP_042470370.1 uncharacterized protein LOC122052750 isoform X1 [Zingiber officinale]XP_042470371.1 uncharacterized protein LOC122052750 isoform X1 [Zingiber officinale]XP_042470373.1 uncharacterized protein LOC122052750 isoform X1 [Zingiber officinale]
MNGCWMMETNKAVDDKDSGWLEVKKKHRTSRKLAGQKAVGSSLVHTFTPPDHLSIHDKTGNRDIKQQFSHSIYGLDYVVSKDEVTGDVTRIAKNHNDNEFFSELSVIQETERLKVKVTDSEVITKATEEVPTKETAANFQKIKWGDLEDITLAFQVDCESTSVSSTKAGGSAFPCNMQEDANLEKVNESTLHVSSCNTNNQKSVTLPSSHEQLSSQNLAMGISGEHVEFTWKEVKEISPEEREVGIVNKNEALPSLSVIIDNAANTASDLVSSDMKIGDSPASPVHGVVQMITRKPHLQSTNMVLDTSKNPNANFDSATIFDLGDGITHLMSDTETAVIRVPTTAATEIQCELHDGLTVGADLTDGQAGESKERFRQRLWCFLFENLNRAVDELYLLCELECDMEQMDEAALVLEEATSDFKALKCRVKHFESTKIPSQSSKDGYPIIIKADNRRPHALSWEVRRMTTSSQRAEILSSSLEAFRKIQLERAAKDTTKDAKNFGVINSNQEFACCSSVVDEVSDARDQSVNSKRQNVFLKDSRTNNDLTKQNEDINKLGKGRPEQSGHLPLSSLPFSVSGKSKREPSGQNSEVQKQTPKKDKEFAENMIEKSSRAVCIVQKHTSDLGKDKDKLKHNGAQWKSMDAWKEKRNWEDILKTPVHSYPKISYSPGMGRKVMDRARVLHAKLMSPEKKKKSAMDLRREAEERHVRAMRIRNQLESERVQKLQRTSEKLNRVTEWQAVRNSKLREVMSARHQRSEFLHGVHLAKVVRKAGDESSKVNEVRFITSLNEQNKKLILRQKLHDSEMRRAEKLQVIKIKQKEDIAREEAVLERRKLLEAEKLQRLAETQRKKEEAQVRREEERKASSAAREAKAVEQLRRKEIRVRARQEEAELLAQKLAERLRESEQRRKYYLEQIREKASMDFREQSSPLQRRLNKEGLSRLMVTSSDDNAGTLSSDSVDKLVNATQQHSLKRRIKKVRQRLMALKHDFVEHPVSYENTGISNRTSMAAVRAKIGRWIQDLQKLRQARKEGAASIGLTVSDVIKFVEGKETELHAARLAGLLDFISSALPASHTSKPEACHVTLHLVRLLRVLLSLPANRSYSLAQNLMPPIIPMLSASLENYIKAAASSSSGSTNLPPSKASNENLELLTEIMDGFLWIFTMIIGHIHFDDHLLQMQDGLMELLVAYQVIHRLRDLFALYDRPQVEGSPFPSSLLLSLALLSVLTSSPGTSSVIDWQSCAPKTSEIRELHRLKDSETMVAGESSVTINNTGDSKNFPSSNQSIELHRDGSAQVSEVLNLVPTGKLLSYTPEARQLGVEPGKGSSSCYTQNVEFVLQRRDNVLSDEFQNLLVKDEKLSSMNKDENFVDGSALRKGTDGHASTKKLTLKQPLMFLLSAISETGLVCLPSLLTAVLLQANNKISSDQGSYILPSNFEEAATGVLKVLNNMANLNISTLQSMLARSDLKVEFFHLMSFLLTHCTNKWKAANDQVGLLLLESLLLLGYFSLFHCENQAVLRWGKSPTILHKICDLPFVFFSDPDLTPILAGTLVAACYGCDQNRDIVLQELSIDMLLSLLKSCKQRLLSVQHDSLQPNVSMTNGVIDSNQMGSDSKRSQGETQHRSTRKISQTLPGRSLPNSNSKINKSKVQRDYRGTRTFDEWISKHNLSKVEVASTFMLHWRFPISFLDRAEEFFSAESQSQ